MSETPVIPLEEFEARKGKPARKPVRFALTNTTELLAKTFDPIRWVIPDLLPEGFAVLAGRQKLGKSFLALDWAVAVATGGYAMGEIKLDAGNVLYVDLENGERRIQRRLNSIMPHHKELPDLSRLDWVTEAPALDMGFLEALEEWRRSVPEPRLVIIDVLQRVKPIGNSHRNAYENDYSIWAPLQAWATTHGISVLGLHRTKKGGADDPLEALSGSNGLSACADTTLVLDRDSDGITLYVRGRDPEEQELALEFEAGVWKYKGDAAKARLTAERKKILQVLEEADAPLGPKDIAALTDLPSPNVRQTLHRMCSAGEIKKAGYGKYVHLNYGPPVTPVTPVTVGGNPRVSEPDPECDCHTFDDDCHSFEEAVPNNFNGLDGSVTGVTPVTGKYPN